MDYLNILVLPAMEGNELLLHLRFHQQFVMSKIERIYVIANINFKAAKLVSDNIERRNKILTLSSDFNSTIIMDTIIKIDRAQNAIRSLLRPAPNPKHPPHLSKIVF